MISRISGAAYLTETHGSSIRLIRIRDYASDHVELHSFVCTPGHATRTLRGSEDMGFGFRVCSSQAASAPETRGALLDHPSHLCWTILHTSVGPSFTAVGPSFTAVGPSFTAVGPSFTAVGPSFTAVGPSFTFTAGRVSPCAWRHCQHSGSQVAAHAPTRSVSAPRAPGPHTRIPPPGSWHLSLHAPPFALRVAVAGRVAPSGYRWALVRLVRLVSSRAFRAYAVQRRIHTPVPPLCRIALPRSLRHHPVWSVL
jgi:hypothetical protein